MTRFLRLLLFSCLTLLLLCLGAVIIGLRQPHTAYIPELGMCDGAPCYLNIVLNKTTWEEAQRILTAVPGYTVKPSYRWTEVASGPVQYLITASNTETIVELNLSLRENAVPLWSIINELGTPCIVLTSNCSIVYLGFRDRIVLVLGRTGNIQPRSQVVEIDLGPAPPAIMTAEQRATHCRTLAGFTKSAWRGFRQYAHR